MKSVIAICVAIVVGFLVLDAAVLWQSTGKPSGFLGFSQDPGSTAQAFRWRSVALLAATLVGIGAGETHRVAMKRRRAKGILRSVLRSPRLVAGLVASPIVFGVVYLLCRDHPDALTAGILAFENGFFWNTVMGKRETEMQDPAIAPG